MPWRRRKRTIVTRLKRKITVLIAIIINAPIVIRTTPQIIAVYRRSAFYIGKVFLSIKRMSFLVCRAQGQGPVRKSPTRKLW